MPFGDGRVDDLCEIGEVVVLRIQRHARAAALAVAAQVKGPHAQAEIGEHLGHMWITPAVLSHAVNEDDGTARFAAVGRG